ncbi:MULTISPECIES: hypothetical protein [Bradyrhizobium]|jgi:hypothetical protein|uniref:Uncharacterized protein n=1 Tax=Bradyrhizobium elkanii TaxID=29448 RepID=A0A8I1Y2N2_BRAEL|nr:MULTISPECIES: hypothetical protein [Bradyrhizobium]MBP1290924.1 hypothetical protein [Bradyrhizobium elkanii]MCP1928762.1 hypothetical protein [Bradyrhizobium elkanii]MCS3473917.1 hypothetical protein [Bradyrhizobium elkanii]MCS3580624.1 hypothetical protein [Bradyrhizobium elkanii]MCS3723500.1 hypothetical protein [Bradyrhizobium elkanii]
MPSAARLIAGTGAAQSYRVDAYQRAGSAYMRLEANRHWFEQIQVESNEAWELFRMFNSTASVAEKVTALQDWAKGVTARSANDATYAIETARSPGTIELNLFARKIIDVDESGLTCRHATLQSAQRTASAKR